MQPRVGVNEGRMEYVSTALTVTDLVQLDEATRGSAAPARTAVWLDETSTGVALRITDLRNGRIIAAENFDPMLRLADNTRRNISLAEELTRKSRGEATLHTFVDVGFFPMQHVALEWLEQWGDTNANLTGLSATIFDPVAGIGGAYYRVIPQAMNLMVGAKVLVSLPSALVSALSGNFGNGGGLFDPMFTAVLVVRWPIFNSNFAVVATLSTNARFTLGISLLNITFPPALRMVP